MVLYKYIHTEFFFAKIFCQDTSKEFILLLIWVIFFSFGCTNNMDLKNSYIVQTTLQFKLLILSLKLIGHTCIFLLIHIIFTLVKRKT